MDFILFPFRFVYKIYFITFFAITFVITYPLFWWLLHKESRFPIAFKFMRLFAKMWLLFSGIIVIVKGKKNLRLSGSVIVSANHSSFIDIPCLYATIQSYFIFTGKKEIERWPLFKIFYTSGMNILVDRHKKGGDLPAMKRMMGVLDKQHPLFIFPEGTITKNAPHMGAFKSGVATLAIKKQVPIIPITFTDNWKRLERKGLFNGKAGPGIAKMIVHEPISTKGLKSADADELLAKLHAIIEAPLMLKKV